MPVVPYVRISIQGALPGGETWSVNPAYAGTFTSGLPTQAELDAWAVAVAADLPSAVGSQLLQFMTEQASITQVRVSAYGDTGALEGYSVHQLATPMIGSGTATSPSTTAIVASLYSAVPGRRYRGRIYWPCLKTSQDPSTGRLPPTALVATAGQFSSMLEDIGNAGGGAFDPFLCVYSKSNGSAIAVTKIRVGDVYDSQRRRKQSLVETYGDAAYPLP